MIILPATIYATYSFFFIGYPSAWPFCLDLLIRLRYFPHPKRYVLMLHCQDRDNTGQWHRMLKKVCGLHVYDCTMNTFKSCKTTNGIHYSHISQSCPHGQTNMGCVAEIPDETQSRNENNRLRACHLFHSLRRSMVISYMLCLLCFWTFYITWFTSNISVKPVHQHGG